MTSYLEDMHAMLQAALSPIAPCQLGVFDEGAYVQIVYDLQQVSLGGWESGQARLAYGTYNVQVYQKNFDPSLPMQCLAALLNKRIGAVMNGETYVDSAGYTVAGLTASLWKEI